MKSKKAPQKSLYIAPFSLLLGVLVIGVVLFFHITAGQTVEKDGSVQNTRIYLTDFSWDGETEWLHFTLHNNTPRKISYGERCYIEVKKNGEWNTAIPRMTGARSIAWYQPAFSCRDRGRDFLAEEQLPREYRVSVQYWSDGGTYSAVGYFIIP